MLSHEEYLILENGELREYLRKKRKSLRKLSRELKKLGDKHNEICFELSVAHASKRYAWSLLKQKTAALVLSGVGTNTGIATDFYVNEKRRCVICIQKEDGNKYYGAAWCSDDDTWDMEIGKAIAYLRAMYRHENYREWLGDMNDYQNYDILIH